MNLCLPVTRATAQTGQMDVGDMDMVKSAAAAASSKEASLDVDFADRWASEQFSDLDRNFSGSATGSLSGQHNASTHYPFYTDHPYDPVGDNDEDIPNDNNAHEMFNNEYDEEYGCAHAPDPTRTICIGTHVTHVRCSRRQSARGPGTTSA